MCTISYTLYVATQRRREVHARVATVPWKVLEVNVRYIAHVRLWGRLVLITIIASFEGFAHLVDDGSFAENPDLEAAIVSSGNVGISQT